MFRLEREHSNRDLWMLQSPDQMGQRQCSLHGSGGKSKGFSVHMEAKVQPVFNNQSCQHPNHRMHHKAPTSDLEPLQSNFAVNCKHILN